MTSPVPVAEALYEWLDDSDKSIRSLRYGLDADQFCDNYLGVIAAGRQQADSIAENLVALVDRAFLGGIDLTEFVDDYIEAMSVSYQGQRVFLPSFTDSCLTDMHPQSPFRGLNFCWLVGEAYYALRRGRTDEAHKILESLEKRLRASHRRPISILQRTGVDLDADIVQIKDMLHDVVTKRKLKWTDTFPYPCRTSTHYYLSGIRFYWSPVVEHSWRVRRPRRRKFADTDRFSVQSTSSGLFSPTERYGYLIPANASTKRKSEVAAHLLDEVPIGCLALDVIDTAPTPNDRKAAKYYERWSDLVAHATLPIVQQTLAECAAALAAPEKERHHLNEGARQRFEVRAARNPMRTFYFDCGLIASARRHLSDPTGTPHVQYVTTKVSDPHNDPSGLGVDMFTKVKKYCEEGLRVYTQGGDHFVNAELPVWTLVPVGSGLRSARTTWSNRSSASTPILHGFEGRTTRLLLDTIAKWGYEHRGHLGADVVGAMVAGKTYARGDMTKDAVTAATTFLLLCAAQSVGGPLVRKRNVHNELRSVPESDTYMEIARARDWSRVP